jgi:hypothetical protein
VYISAVHLALEVGKRANDLFVEDMVLGDFNLAKVRWKVDEETVALKLLKLGLLQKAYEIELLVCYYKFEIMKSRTQRYICRMVDCPTIVNELILVDWYSLFCGRGINGCVHLFYEMVWSCFERHLPTKFSRGGWKLPWITRES